MSEIEVAREQVEMVPDRWAQTGWKWQHKNMPKTYFQHRLIETFKEPEAPTAVDSAHQGLVPSPWKKNGWRYVTADYQPKLHPNRRNFERTRRKECFHASFTTTTMASFADPGPSIEVEQHKRHMRKKQNVFPPLPMDVQLQPATTHRKTLSDQYYSPPKNRTMTLGGLLNPGGTRALPLGWAGEPINPVSGCFHKRKQHETEWTELLLSGGVNH